MADSKTAFRQALGVLLLGGIPATVDGSRIAINDANPQENAPADISDRERANRPGNFLMNVSQSQILLGTLAVVAVIGAVAFLRK